MSRFGLDRFKKAQTTEPFQVDEIRAATQAHVSRLQQSSASPQASLATGTVHQSTPQVVTYLSSGAASLTHPHSQGNPPPQSLTPPPPQSLNSTAQGNSEPAVPAVNPNATTVGQGASTWHAPDWAVEPRRGVYYLEVSKEGQVVDKLLLDKKRTMFGRQHATCDYVLDHPSLSRQHAAVVHHKNGSVFVIDVGSVHGTFVSNERLQKDIPLEIEPGQSLRFAASSRTYILRKSMTPPPAHPALSAAPAADIPLPVPPDPSDGEAVLQYNTLMNRLGHPVVKEAGGAEGEEGEGGGRKRKRKDGDSLPGFAPKSKVRFRDENGGILVEVVGFSDGFHVATEPGPVGVKEGGSLVGKFDSIVQSVFIPRVKTKNSSTSMDSIASPSKQLDSPSGTGMKAAEKGGGVANRLREYLGKSLAAAGGLYDSSDHEAGGQKKGMWGKPDKAEGSEPSKAVQDSNSGKVQGQRDADDDMAFDLFGTKNN